jgi:hypothetical protein
MHAVIFFLAILAMSGVKQQKVKKQWGGGLIVFDAGWRGKASEEAAMRPMMFLNWFMIRLMLFFWALIRTLPSIKWGLRCMAWLMQMAAWIASMPYHPHC